MDRAIADAKPERRFKASAINVPDESDENDALAFDLDQDSRRSLDNKMGSIFQISEDYLFFDVQDRVDTEVAAGRMNVTGSLRWNGGEDEEHVALELMPGQRVYGHVYNGVFTSTEPGELTLEASLLPGVGNVTLRLVAVRAEVMLTGGVVVSAKIGGGILRSRLKEDILEPLYTVISGRVAADPGTEQTRPLAQLFDTNKDGAISSPSSTTRTRS